MEHDDVLVKLKMEQGDLLTQLRRRKQPLQIVCAPPAGYDFEAENLISESEEQLDSFELDSVEDRKFTKNKFTEENAYLPQANQNGLDANFLSRKLNEALNDEAQKTLHQSNVDNTARNRDGLSTGGFFNFFWFELTRGYALENDEARYTEKRKKVYAFVHIPKELEKFLFYGCLQCLDAFLYVFTFLPLRFIVAVFHLLSALCSFACGGKRRRFLAPGETCDILKVIIILTASFSMTFIDTSVVYHVVRGQAVIKLYIFFNMLEVADKLFSSFGQDILDALFWTATEPRRRNEPSLKQVNYFGFGVVTHLILAIAYVFFHTGLVLLQATTLNVAFNSHNKALLTIMLSNNFVELKGNVFKKFAKNNLFQMACSDVRERFHYFILLSVVVVRNMTAVDWRAEHFFEMVPDLLLVIFGELLVDWIKHAFITKFNEIPYEVYKDFTITIAYDAAKSRDVAAFSDHSDQVARRMGFIPLPLSVLAIRILTQSFPCESTCHVLLWLMTFVSVLLFKIFNSIFVLGKAARHIRQYEELQKRADLWKRLSNKHRSKSVPSSPRLSLIEFTDVMQQNHPVSTKGFVLTACDILSQQVDEWNVPFSPPPCAAAASLESKLKRRSKSVAYLDNARRMQMHLFENDESSAAGANVAASSGAPSPAPDTLSPTLSPVVSSPPPVASLTLPALSVAANGEEMAAASASPTALSSHSPKSCSSFSVPTAGTATTAATTVPQSPAPATSNNAAVTGGSGDATASGLSSAQEMQALLGVDRYTLVNGDRIES